MTGEEAAEDGFNEGGVGEVGGLELLLQDREKRGGGKWVVVDDFRDSFDFGGDCGDFRLPCNHHLPWILWVSSKGASISILFDMLITRSNSSVTSP